MTNTDTILCLCHRPEFANHGTCCPCCEETRNERDRIAEEDEREREWLSRYDSW